jgi:hypothetical protein
MAFLRTTMLVKVQSLTLVFAPWAYTACNAAPGSLRQRLSVMIDPHSGPPREASPPARQCLDDGYPQSTERSRRDCK